MQCAVRLRLGLRSDHLVLGVPRDVDRGRLGHCLGRPHEHQHLALFNAQRLPVCAVLDDGAALLDDRLSLDQHVGERERRRAAP